LSFLEAIIPERLLPVLESCIDTREEGIGMVITSKPRCEESKGPSRCLVKVGTGKSSWQDLQQSIDENIDFRAVDVAISRRSRSLELSSTTLKALSFLDFSFLALEAMAICR
jgi:hypothetical protein